MKKFRRMTILLITILTCFWGIQAMAANPSDLGRLVTNMPDILDGGTVKNVDGDMVFITLAEDKNYRWNVNNTGVKGNVVHLDDVEGENCTFRLTKYENEWYGIKYIKDGGTDRYVDVEDKSTKEGKVLHIWEEKDSEIKGNEHRQFAFYEAGKDSAGNQMYYIKIRKSGLWVGTENNKVGEHQKLVQTSKAKKWYVTPCTVPLDGKEINGNTLLGHHVVDAISCELFLENSMDSLNIADNDFVDTNRTKLNYFTLGFNYRWALKWVHEYQAYEVESVGREMRKLYTSNKVIDVRGESGKDQALIHLWTKQSKDTNANTSQLWRFVKQSDGRIWIQNARSGKYISKNGSGNAIIDSIGFGFEISLLSPVTMDNEGTLFDLNTVDTTWMASIPNDALLSSINIPGTHDTGTASIIEDLENTPLGATSLTRCQKYYFEEQLQIGARSFDIRCSADGSDADVDDVKIVHGGDAWICFGRDGSVLKLEDIFEYSKEFLHENSSETIILKIKPDGGSESGLAHAVAKYVGKNRDLFWHEETIPSMGEARGKIILLRRFEVSDSFNTEDIDDRVQKSWLGLDITTWDSYSYGDTKGLVKIYEDTENDTLIYAQDAYNEVQWKKEDYIKAAFEDSMSASVPKSAYVYNYTSSAAGFPTEITRRINPWIYHSMDELIEKGKVGMVMFNYIDQQTSRLIYETNKSMSFAYPKATFPTVELTYGQKLGEGVFVGKNGNGQFQFAPGADLEAILDAGTYTYKMEFQPKDERLSNIIQDVTVIVHPKPVTVKWTTKTEDLIWTGSPVNITAEIVGLVGDDKCDVVVKGGNEIGSNDTSAGQEAEIYYAVATELTGEDKGNYIYAEEEPDGSYEYEDYENSRLKSYIIRNADTTYVMPKLAVITYGETLEAGNIRWIAGSGDGTFELCDSQGDELGEEELTKILSAGVHNGKNETVQYSVRFKPTNDTEKTEAVPILLFVAKKRITVTADSVEKIYGDVAPELTWKVDEDTPLVNGHTEDDLLTLQALNEDNESGTDVKSSAGTYEITMAEQKNPNYRITFIPGTLTIQPKEVEIIWSGATEYTYGQPNLDTWLSTGSKLDVLVNGVITGDSCSPDVVNTNNTNARTYWARVTGLDNPNYCLPESLIERSLKYVINKAVPEVTFPENAKVAEGGKLGDAKFSGGQANVAGSFEFDIQDEEITEDGLYLMRFVPEDTQNYEVVEQLVKVTIDPKTSGTDPEKDPSVNTDTEATDKPVSAVDTNDHATVGLWIILAGIALLVIVLRKKIV